MFNELPEGQTHYENDRCGMKEHNCCHKCKNSPQYERGVCGMGNCPCHQPKKRDEHTMDCATNACEAVDEACAMGCTCKKPTPDTKAEEWEKEWDERFKWFFDSQTNESLKDTIVPDEMKKFIRTHKEQWVSEERERIFKNEGFYNDEFAEYILKKERERILRELTKVEGTGFFETTN